MVVIKSRQLNDVFSSLGLGYLGQFLGQRINELVLAACRRKGFPQMRISHGYIIQHLVRSEGPVARTGSELARRMGISQQAASKAIAELVRLGVVEISGAQDRRAKEVRLTDLGWRGVQYSRSVRARIERRLCSNVGVTLYAEARKTMQVCLELTGGVTAIQSRRVKPPQ